MNSIFATPLGRYRVTVERCTVPRALTPTEIRAEADALIDLLRHVYLASMGEADKAKGWTPEKKAAMVAKMKATRLARGIDWPRGDNHWTRQPSRKRGLW
jgi:hypothetical protein